ncbi:MAG: rod shape-determining protein RodA [Acidaminococcales bacterium]|jgi:rod shape determining protein RodA|nr:rod shape-determining protein RodA [Acidaminococcales bacterium]
MFDNRLLRNLDFILIIAVVLLNVISIVMITSATHVNSLSIGANEYVQKQALFFLLNLVLAFFFLRFDYGQREHLGAPLYIFNIFMLLAVMFAGHSALGAQRWLQIGPLSVQPSEFAKIITIIGLANILNRCKENLNGVWDAAPVLGYVFLPFLLVLKQPDLGTSLVFLFITAVMLYIAGMPARFYGYLTGIMLALTPVFWHLLKDYQKQRILVFLNPERDPYNSGYHVIQSKIAIGSGMLTGKGLFAGTQSQLSFLPENHTDFIFAVIGEELGFVGVMVVLILYGVIFYRGIKIAMEAKDDFGALLAIGIVSMLAFHIVVNIGMTVGIMPVTGIPLPFMSYGVSSLTANMLCVSILLNINMRRKILFF